MFLSSKKSFDTCTWISLETWLFPIEVRPSLARVHIYLAHCSSFAWPPKKGRHFSLLTQWDSSLVVTIFLIVPNLYLVGVRWVRFLALWVRGLGLLNSFYYNIRKSFYNLISPHTPNHESREEDVLCPFSLFWTWSAQGVFALSKWIKLNFLHPTLLCCKDLESPCFVLGSEGLWRLHRICLKFSLWGFH